MVVEALPTPSAPPVAGPYSPAVRAGDWIALAGQVGLDPITGVLVGGGIEAETRQVLANIGAVLADCAATWSDVAKFTIYLAATMDDFPTVNACYAEALGDHRPARSTVAVAALPLGALVEIEALVYLPDTTSPKPV
jgi:2-iminobutanoate/2-iminopropanoate deaminase